MNTEIGKTQLNIIVHNDPESVATESAARIAHDNNYITDIANIIDACRVEILDITSLDKKLDDKPGLLKVQLSNLQQKRRILLYFHKVYVTPDLSLNERQENERLRDELFQHKNTGEKI